ncbi:hypothetical protein [Empedobacter brevis]|uniref:hypothetical protein n=1 Tax=Empedobacter brevis TaxID=247 RepID=UPI0023F39586|nr:hypothetical protein [Empedobacter brevis]
MALKTIITSDNGLIEVYKDRILLYSETICYEHEIESPVRDIYDYLGIEFGDTIKITVDVSNTTINTSIYKDESLYYRECIHPNKLYNIEDCLFFKVYWLFYEGKFETSDREAINLLLSEISEIKNGLNKI